jgi:small conductance mechanosensitive channel
MTTSILSRWLLASGLVLLLASALTAQGVAEQLSGETRVELDVFKKLLATQHRSDLAKLADGWAARLKSAAETHVQAPSAATQVAFDTTLERLPVVLDQWESAGGDADAIKAHREYVSRLAGQRPKGDMMENITQWVTSTDGGIKWAINIGLFALTLIAFKIIASILGGIVGRALRVFKSSSDLLRNFFVNTIKQVTFFVGLVIALSFIGVPTAPFLAALGAAGFVIGFALQGTLNNFAAGIIILLYRPYEIGDFVTVAGASGTVQAMTLVSTTLHTGDNQIIVVPNGSIWGDVITNVTGNPTRRIDFTFGIGYGDDLAKAQGILERIIAADERVLKDPDPVIRVHELADSSVNFVVRPWVKTTDYWAVRWDIIRAVKEQFDASGVSIPFPQRDVHLHQVGTGG